MTDNEIFKGTFWRDQKHNDTIYITLESQDLIAENNIDYDGICGAINRWFVDKLGFKYEDLIISDDTNNHSLRLVAKVRFINEGYVIAKLQGILH